MTNDPSGAAGSAMPAAPRRVAFLPVRIETRTEELHNHIAACRDQAELVFLAVSSMAPNIADPLLVGLVKLMDDLRAAEVTIGEADPPPAGHEQGKP